LGVPAAGNWLLAADLWLLADGNSRLLS